MVKKNLGDYVEAGVVDAPANSLTPESITFLVRVTWPPMPALGTNAKL
jgi:hypothetical protein